MKQIIVLLPILFLAKVGLCQFNTASYANKTNSVNISEFSENHFNGTFLTYHIEGKAKKKKRKEKEESNHEEIAENTAHDTVAFSPNLNTQFDEIPLQDFGTISFFPIKEKPKKLQPISDENFEVTSNRQLVFMPLDDLKITSDFGVRFHPIKKRYLMHNGIDLKAYNSYVYAVLDGEITYSGYDSDAGMYVKINHNGYYETSYLHLDKFFVKKGDPIKAGDIIGVSGNTGLSTGEHLHFAVKENGQYINPITFLNSLIQTNNAIIDYASK